MQHHPRRSQGVARGLRAIEGHLLADLIWPAKDVRIVLLEPSQPCESTQRSRGLVPSGGVRWGGTAESVE